MIYQTGIILREEIAKTFKNYTFAGEKHRPFLPLLVNPDDLPRQARDKRNENSNECDVSHRDHGEDG